MQINIRNILNELLGCTDIIAPYTEKQKAITDHQIRFLINQYSIFLFNTCIPFQIEFEIYLVDSTILFFVSVSVFSDRSSDIIFIPISDSIMLYILFFVALDKEVFAGIRNSVVGNFLFLSKIMSSKRYFDICLEKKKTTKIKIMINDTSLIYWNPLKNFRNPSKSFFKKKKYIAIIGAEEITAGICLAKIEYFVDQNISI